MKRILTFALFVLTAAASVQTPALAFQKGKVTYELSGGADGAIAVTLNYTTRQVTWIYANGYQYTTSNVDFDAVARWAATSLRRAEEQPD